MIATNVQKLYNWLNDLKQDFGTDAPDPQKIDSILNVVRNKTGVNLGRYLGAGDNGIAFGTDQGTVLKFTIDNNEAALWGRLKNHKLSGIIPSYGVYHLTSNNTGDTIVYVTHVGYAPKQLDSKLNNLIRDALSNADQSMQDQVRQYKTKYNKLPDNETRHKMRTLNFVKAFQKAATLDPRLNSVPEALISLADSYSSHLYDLTPQNFQLDNNDNVVLIDPSLPDMSGEVAKPSRLVFEARLRIALYVEEAKY